MARYTRADVIVVGLIGERGREVKDFMRISRCRRACTLRGDCRSGGCFSSPANAGCRLCHAHCRRFRDRGQHVLLIWTPSPATRWPSVKLRWRLANHPPLKVIPRRCFAKLPALVERAGNGISGGGSITAFYTVLTEGDDQQDPIADSARAILDGHMCCLADWRKPGTIRLSILKRRSAAQ
ncbi:flagellum-specific ATP synthase [Escherichia coli]|uniref:Flagellum-specific ATP synthase n=1 Tax=Escherichia coli TaxID=562 RepID=A0A376U8N5_ECOLX|nr:flagellum-specific ATP synthase [Escherichia coli]